MFTSSKGSTGYDDGCKRVKNPATKENKGAYSVNGGFCALLAGMVLVDAAAQYTPRQTGPLSLNQNVGQT